MSLKSALDELSLYKRITHLELSLEALIKAVENMRVPQTIADAGMQIMIIGPVLENARKTLAEGRLPEEKPVCRSCQGEGKFIDTTYDRAGEERECGACFGTGKSTEEIRQMVKRAWRAETSETTVQTRP